MTRDPNPYSGAWPFDADREADIRRTWVDGDPFGDDCGEWTIQRGRDHAILEVLRDARTTVHTLLREIDRLRKEQSQ